GQSTCSAQLRPVAFRHKQQECGSGGYCQRPARVRPIFRSAPRHRTPAGKLSGGRMKKTLIALAAAAVASMAFAEPFVWPSAWSTEDPADANYGGTYRVYDVSDIKTFNPAVTDTQTQSFTGLWFDQAQLIMRGPDSDDWLPYAASSFEVSEDGLSVSVTLRDNLKWSDGETLD